MSENSYETGRLNLPFVGICTFAKSPLCLDWDRIDADVAVMGAPFDCGTQWRAGARFGASEHDCRVMHQRKVKRNLSR